jgi:hypothetical protein
MGFAISSVDKLRSIGVCLMMAMCGCATTMAEIPTSDHNVLVIRGYGSKSMVAQKCLTAETIKQLISTEIPQSAAGKPCYWVALISSDSTDISKAVTAFIRAKDEFDDKVLGLAAPSAQKATDMKKAAPEKSNAVDAASSILAAAVTEDTGKLVTQTSKLRTDEKVEVKSELKKLRAGVTDDALGKKLDAVLAAP